MVFLVDDIWMLIVGQVCAEHDPRARAFSDAARCLSLVCRQLCDVVASMPQFWQNLIIDSHSSAEYVEKYPLRCGSRLLKITVLHNTGGDGYLTVVSTTLGGDRGVLCTALQAAADATHRWDTLQVKTRFPCTIHAVLNVLLDRDAPSLARLSLCCQPSTYVLRPLPAAFRCGTPGLTHLELVGIPVPWAQPELFVGLEHLSVRLPPPGSMLPRHGELMHIMKAARKLVILELENIDISDCPILPALRTHAVPSLTTLVLSIKTSVSSTSLRRWLDAFVFPNLVTLYIEFERPLACIHWVGAHLFGRLQHVALGGVFVTRHMTQILAAMTAVRVLDVRGGPDLAELLWRDNNVCMKQLEQLWIYPAHLPDVRLAATVRKAAGFPLKTVVCENSLQDSPTVQALVNSGRASLSRWVGTFIERDPTEPLRTYNHFAF